LLWPDCSSASVRLRLCWRSRAWPARHRGGQTLRLAHAHPADDCAITTRDAARLQSFDDDFVFPPLINPVSQMIGNAIPPLLMSAFGHHVATFLDSRSQEVATAKMTRAGARR
jgi:site-specific DNA-cytosine methylase